MDRFLDRLGGRVHHAREGVDFDDSDIGADGRLAQLFEHGLEQKFGLDSFEIHRCDGAFKEVDLGGAGAGE